MKLKIFTVDAFTEKVFSGNQAAVVPLDQDFPDELLQSIAAEMNISETSFVRSISEENISFRTNKKFSLRWMTPTNEVNLCGHGTLATAHVLFFEYGNVNDVLEFETLSGSLFTRKQGEKICMNFPISEGVELNTCEAKVASELTNKISKTAKIKEMLLTHEPFNNLLVRLEDNYTRQEFEKIDPVAEDLSKIHDGSLVNGIILTLKGEKDEVGESTRGLEDFHFVSRYFAPWNGINEDPVTGSAHCTSGPYWAKHFNTKELTCRQCSRRGGNLDLKIEDGNKISIIGRGKTVIEGFINI